MSHVASESTGRPQNIVVVIRLQGWDEAENFPDHLTSWCNSVMSNVYHYLKTTHGIDPTFQQVIIVAEGTKERRKTLSDILGKVSEKIQVRDIAEDQGSIPRCYALACYLASYQAWLYERQTVSYVLVTNDDQWYTNLFWRKMSVETKEGHMIRYESVPPEKVSKGNKDSLAQVFDPIYLKQPDACWHFPNKGSMSCGKGDLYTTADEPDIETALVPVEKDTTSKQGDDGDIASTLKRALKIVDDEA